MRSRTSASHTWTRPLDGVPRNGRLPRDRAQSVGGGKEATLKRSLRRVSMGMTATVAAVLAFGVFGAASASADTAPVLTCGNTQPGPCHQTAHFTNDDEFGTPLSPAPGCPAFVQNDYVHIVGTGHGIEHVNVNRAQDAWFTFTFTGNVTLTAYPPSSLSFDKHGNVTGIIGPPDPSVPVFTGKLTEWFGGSFNNKNSVNTGTIHVSATGDGQSLSVHAVFHAAWGVGADPNGPPTRAFQKVNC
jgi:hypothetical protein